MKGVEFVVDEHGKPKSVLIDLDIWGELWEDFYDVMMVEASRTENPPLHWYSPNGSTPIEMENT